jgi:hypothetical protein
MLMAWPSMTGPVTVVSDGATKSGHAEGATPVLWPTVGLTRKSLLPQRRAAGGLFRFGGSVAKVLTLAEQIIAREVLELVGVGAAREFRDVLKAAKAEGRCVLSGGGATDRER